MASWPPGHVSTGQLISCQLILLHIKEKESKKSPLVLRYSKSQPQRQSYVCGEAFCQSRIGQMQGNADWKKSLWTLLLCATEIHICMFSLLHSKCSKVGYKIVNTLLFHHPCSQRDFICNKEWWLSTSDDSFSCSKRLNIVTLFALSFSQVEEAPISTK